MNRVGQMYIYFHSLSQHVILTLFSSVLYYGVCCRCSREGSMAASTFSEIGPHTQMDSGTPTASIG